MGLGHPAGPIIDKLGAYWDRNPLAYVSSKPHIPGYDYSFSGFGKHHSFYSLRDWLKRCIL